MSYSLIAQSYCDSFSRPLLLLLRPFVHSSVYSVVVYVNGTQDKLFIINNEYGDTTHGHCIPSNRKYILFQFICCQTESNSINTNFPRKQLRNEIILFPRDWRWYGREERGEKELLLFCWDENKRIIFHSQGNHTKFLKTLHTEQVAKLQMKNQHECELLEDIRQFTIKRSAIEKSYSESLLKLSSVYLNKKMVCIPEIKLDGSEKW